MHFSILPDNQKLFFNKYILYHLEWLKPCFDAFAITSRQQETFLRNLLPDHQKHFFKKDFFDLQECLKMCFDAFAHAYRPPVTFFQKRYFLPSGVVKNVFACICAHFQTTRNISSKMIFLTFRSA